MVVDGVFETLGALVMADEDNGRGAFVFTGPGANH